VLGTAGEAVTAVDGLLHDARDAAARVGDGTVQPDRVAPARPHAAPTGADAWIPVPDGRAIREDLDGGVFYMWPPKLGTGPVAHFFGFAVAGLLLTIGLRSQPRVHVLWYLFLVALSTECLQAFYFTREAELDDLVMNSAGIAVGVTTASVVLALARARRSVAPRLTMG
jgi:hypothetical protein